ncbi:alpha/beta fold hydrolase [Microbacterium lacticum]
MPYVTRSAENGAPIELYYEDFGTGRPVVLLQGYPLDGAAWEPQTLPLLEAGYRVITIDRRGFGRSSRVATPFGYDELADDVDALIQHLHLSDVTLVGFSMGTAEVARYIGRHGSGALRSAVMLAPFGPGLSLGSDGVGFPDAVFTGIQDAIRADRHQYVENYFLQHYVAEQNLGTRVSAATIRANVAVGAAAGASAMLHCVTAWKEDFRADLPKIDVPLLVMQGTEDRNIPIDVGARRIPSYVPSATIIEVEGGPHGIGVTHPEVVNPALLEFLAT